MASELEDVIVVNDLDATLNYHELSREELDVPCTVDHCRELAMKLERWEPLLPYIGLDECDRTAIEKDYSSYEEQRIAVLSKWKRLYGSTATYLKLAKGLEKIGHFNLVDELCKIYKSKQAEPSHQNLPTQQFMASSLDGVIVTQPSRNDATVRLPSLDDVFEQYGLSKEELNTPCSNNDCTELAMKLDRWELLAQVIGLTQADCTAIKANSISYEQQRVAALFKWRGNFGSRATYLKLAEGLEKIGHLDLVDELCKIYKSESAEPYHHQDISEDEKETLIKRTAKEPTHLKQGREWKEILDDNIIKKTRIVSLVIFAIAWILYNLQLVSYIILSPTLIVLVIIFLHGIGIPMVQTYYIGGALLKKANGDVWKNVVIGGGLLGGLIGGVYWIFMGKNIPGTHLATVFGISVSVVMFGTILAGVLLGMAINRGTFLRIIFVLVVGSACFYAISPDYEDTMDSLIYSYFISNFNPGHISFVVLLTLYLISWKYFPGMLLFLFIILLMYTYTYIISLTLLCIYLTSFYYGIWPPIAGAYWGTVFGVVWAYFNNNYYFCEKKVSD